jgi:hypothetical protein
VSDFSDKQPSVVVYDVPGVGTAQLCRPQRVDDAAGIELRVDIGYPASITSREYPHDLRPPIVVPGVVVSNSPVQQVNRAIRALLQAEVGVST